MGGLAVYYSFNTS